MKNNYSLVKRIHFNRSLAKASRSKIESTLRFIRARQWVAKDRASVGRSTTGVFTRRGRNVADMCAPVARRTRLQHVASIVPAAPSDGSQLRPRLPHGAAFVRQAAGPAVRETRAVHLTAGTAPRHDQRQVERETGPAERADARPLGGRGRGAGVDDAAVGGDERRAGARRREGAAEDEGGT